MGALSAAVIVLCGAIALLQWHSVQFWVAQVGPTGIGFSLLLDAMGLWLWYQRTFVTRALGVLASVLVLAGPIYWVATPIIDQSARTVHGDAARSANIAELERDIAQRQSALERLTATPGGTEWVSVIRQTQNELAAINAQTERMKQNGEPVPDAMQRTQRNLRADLRKYQHMATRGADSIDVVQRAQNELAERRARLTELRAISPSVQVEERAMLIVAMQVFALILFQLGAVLAINRISVLRAVARVQPMATAVSTPNAEKPVDTVPVSPVTAMERQSVPEKTPEKIPEKIAATLAPPPIVRPIRRPEQQRPNGGKVDADNITMMRRARRAIEEQLTMSGMTHQQFADALGVSPGELQLFLRHEELTANGGRTASKSVVDKILTQYRNAMTSPDAEEA